MNTLTAIRTFAKPSFTPVKHTRIFAERWYKVTFQNVETDPRCDYVGLAKGEYTELLPGNKAREARVARLNHCNNIQEWHGEVWEVVTSCYGHLSGTRPVFRSSQESAKLTVDVARQDHAKWVSDVAKEQEHYRAQLVQHPDQTWRQGSIDDCQRILDAGMSTFQFTIRQIR